VVERTFTWISRWRRLARDHEGLPQSSEAFITLAMSRRMLSRLRVRNDNAKLTFLTFDAQKRAVARDPDYNDETQRKNVTNG
jgi:hypothetical protein